MLMRRSTFIAILTLWLAGCAATPGKPDAGGNPIIERLSPEELARIMPKPNPKLPLESIVRMSKAGATPQEVIGRIKETGSAYELTASQLIDLNKQGVSQEVLDYIQSAREQALRDRITDEINQREARHAEQLQHEQQLRRYNYYQDPYWSGYPGYSGYYGYSRPYGPFSRFGWRW
jgi:hypothetical protein